MGKNRYYVKDKFQEGCKVGAWELMVVVGGGRSGENWEILPNWKLGG